MTTHFFAGLIASAAIASVLGSAPALAFTFGTDGIEFDRDTKVDFTFNESRGSFQSTLQIFQVGSENRLTWTKDMFAETRASDNGSANGWLGTCGEGKTVQGNCSESFIFLKNIRYALGLDSGSNGKVYSTSSLNTKANGTLWISDNSPQRGQQAVFGAFGSTRRDGIKFNNPENFQSGDPFASQLKISFDDRGYRNAWGIPDLDFQDFSVTASTVSAIPEPASLAGLGVVGIAIAASRRRTREIN